MSVFLCIDKKGVSKLIIKKIGWVQFITYIFLFVVLTGCLSTYETDSKVYVAVALYILCFFPYALFWRSLQVIKYPVFVSIIMIFVWFYGFAVGLINGNNTSYVIRNFAGMSTYILVFPLLNSNISTDKYLCIIKKASKYALFISVFTYIMLTYFHLDLLYKIPIVNAFVGRGGIGGFVQYFCRELIHVTFAYNFFLFITKKRGVLTPTIILLFTVYATVVVNDSGGDILAMGIIAIIILLTQSKHLNSRAVLLGVIAIVGVVVLYLCSGEGLLSKLFSSADGGNIRRWEEINYFKNNMTFWGHGLGKELGHAGANGFNYGTEMIYLNIFHKFGIFALLILVCYFSTCIKAINYLTNNNDKNPDKVIPLALMAYLIPSLANPMLFGVLTVVSHLLAMIIIAKEENKKSMLLGKY